MAVKIEPAMKQPWPGPEGLIPVTDGNASDANVIARRYLDSILLEMRMIDTAEADTRFHLWGREFASPVMTPAFSHLEKVGKDGRDPMVEYAKAAGRMNLVNWVGMEPDEEFGKILSECADSIRIIKPFADHDLILRQISYAETHGAFAVGIDIDHIIGTDGKYDVVDGYPMGQVTFADLVDFVHSTGLPFIVKGVLSAEDARKCADAGVKGIVISHHHGRLKYAVPPVMALQEIVPVLKEKDVKIFVDCHMDTGCDAFKALALGADAVCIGRPILRGLLADGAEAVEKIITSANQELKEIMGYTGIHDLSEMTPEVLRINGRKPYTEIK